MAEDLIADLVGDEADTTGEDTEPDRAKVFGDQAYGTGDFQSHLEDNDIDSGCKTQSPSAPGGLFTKDRFRSTWTTAPSPARTM